MKIKQWFVVTFTAVTLLPCSLAQTASKPHKKSCWDTATAQAALDDCAQSDFRNADKQLEQVYQALIHKIKGDSVAMESLKNSEHAWLVFRDAQMKALHPHPNQEGSVSPMCRSSEMAQLTLERVKMLQQMLNTKEGDVCAYSPP